MEEYLTIAEVAARLKIKPKTIKNKMVSGIFCKGVHYFSRPGLGPRFKWSAVVAWLEESFESPPQTEEIPMPQSYRFRKKSGDKSNLVP